MRYEAEGLSVLFGPAFTAWSPQFWEEYMVCVSPGQAYAMAYLLNGGDTV